MKIDLNKVPLRDKNMTAYEIMLSESQERMLVVVKAGQEEELSKIFHRWELDAVKIGEVIEGTDVVGGGWVGEYSAIWKPDLFHHYYDLCLGLPFCG